MDKRRWGALGLFAVALNATCGGPKSDTGGQSGGGGVVEGEGQTETRRSALTEPNIAPPALLATEPYGVLPGGGAVSLDGNFGYSVPIDVPPGRAGMAPSLSLAYSSRGGNGAVGMGWRVGGLSSISRCVRSASAGGTRKGIEIVPGDEYCLDGIRLAKTKGNQGAANSEYRTETDMAAKIMVTRAGATGPQEWTVHFKSGRIATYARPSSEVWTRRRAYNADGSFLLAGEDVDMTWPIVKETDRAYNRIDYKYTMSHTAESSFPLPYRIEYTKCDQSPCAYPDAQIRRVEFVYTPIAQSEEYLTTYTNGVFLSLKKQLSEVHVSVQSGTSTTYNVVRKYKLRYLRSPLTKRYLLQGIKLCDRLDVCIPETTFTWNTQNGVTHQVRGGETGSPDLNVRLVSLTHYGEKLVPESGIVAYDADGDGNDDLLVKDWMNLIEDTKINAGSGDPAPVDLVALSDGAGFFNTVRKVDMDGDGLSPLDSRCTENDILDTGASKPVDLDGDGSMELLAVINVDCPVIKPNNERWLPYSGLRGRDPAMAPRYGVLAWDPAKRTLTRRLYAVLDGSDALFSKVELVDLNGDGLPELLAANTNPAVTVMPNLLTTSGNWQVWDANPSGMAAGLPQVVYGNQRATPLKNYPAFSAGRYRRPTETVTDEDGDGRFELMQLANDGTMRSYGWVGPMGTGLRARHAFRDTVVESTNTLYLQVNETQVNVVAPTDSDPSPGSTLWRFADVNGDGLKDAFYREGGSGNPSWEVRPNTGAGYGPARPLGADVAARLAINVYPGDAHVDDVGTRKGVDNGLRIADINGDGRDDLILLRPATGGSAHWSGYLSSTSPIRVMYSNGYNFETPVELPSHGRPRLWREAGDLTCTGSSCRDSQMRFPMSAIGDFDGNGIADIVEFVDGTEGGFKWRKARTYSLPLPGGADRMVNVRDHMALNAQTITYDNMSSGSFRRLALPDTTPDTHVSDVGQPSGTAQCRYPARCMTRGMPVVAKFVDNRHGRTINNTYNYTGGRTDAMGKGWLGFRQTRVTDGVTGQVTYRTFDNQPWPSGFGTFKFRHFPRAFQPLNTVVSEPGTGANHHSSLSDATGMIPRSSTAWTPVHVTKGPTGEEIVALQKSTTVQQFVDMPPNFTVREYQTIIDYDGYGNPTFTQTKQQDFAGPNRTTSYTQEVTTGYTNNETNWLIGMGHTVTDVAYTTKDVYATGCASGICRSSTRVTTYEYNPTSGLLTKIHRNPGSSDSSVKGDTILERDTAGLVTKVRRLSADNPVGFPAATCTSNAQCVTGEQCLNEGGAALCRRVRESGIQYDATGSVAEGFTNAANHVRWRLADPATGRLYATVDPNGFERVIKRDGLGRPRESTGEDGSKVTTSYGALVSSFSTAIALGRVERYVVTDGQSGARVFDMQGRPQVNTWSTFDNQTGVMRFSYDALGNVSETRYTTVATPHADATGTSGSLTSALNAAASGTVIQSARFDAAGRPVTSTEGAGNTTSYSYTTSMAVGETDPVGNFRLVYWDAAGRTKEVSEYLANAAGQQLRTFYNYDERGNLARLAPPEGAAQIFEYDILGRRRNWEIKDARSSRTFATYDSFDEVLSDQDAFYDRDALGRVVTRHGASAGDDQSYVWDVGVGAIGNLSSARVLRRSFESPQPTTEHESVNTYDSMGRLVQRRERFKNGDSLSVGYGYDSRGRLGSIRYPEASGSGDAAAASGALPGPTVAYLYKNGQLESLRDVGDNNKVLWQATKRHLFGMIAEATTTNALTTTWTYYPDTLRPFTQATTRPAGGSLPSQTFKYYANGMLSERTTSGVLEKFQYDKTNRLWKYRRDGQVIDAEFKYNGAGNMTMVDMTASTNSPDWPLADETMTYGSGGSLDTDQLRNLYVGNNPRVGSGHDHPGNRLINERAFPNDDAGILKRTYEYSSFNLPSVIDDVATGRKITFLYDAGGTRVRKTSSTGDDVAYIGQLYERRKLPGYSTTESVYRLIADGGVVGELAHAWNSNNRVTRFFFKDHQGSIAYEIAGNVVKRLGFFPFGKRSGTPPAQAFSQLGYTGHMHDDDLGLINMRGRAYHVAQRRFLTPDPMLGTPFRTGGANPYAYVRNNPVNRNDPSGFQEVITIPTVVITAPDLQGLSQGQAAQAEQNAQANSMSSSQPSSPSGNGPGDTGNSGGFMPGAREFVENLAGDLEAVGGYGSLHAAESMLTQTEIGEEVTEMLGWPKTEKMGTAVMNLLESGFEGQAGKLFTNAEKLGSAAGGVGAVLEVVSFVEAMNKGDSVEAAISGFKLSSELVGRLGGPVGASFDAGMAIGEAIAPLIDHGFMSDIYLSVGEKIVGAFGMPVDRGAAR